MGSLPLTNNHSPWKKPLRQGAIPSPPEANDFFIRKGLTHRNNQTRPGRAGTFSVATLEEENAVYRKLFSQVPEKSSFQSDLKGFSIPSCDDWDKDADWNGETTCPTPTNPKDANEYWISEIITKPSEPQMPMKSDSPQSTNSLAERETLVIRLTRRKETPKVSPVNLTSEKFVTPDESTVGWACRPRPGSISASVSSNESCSSSDQTAKIALVFTRFSKKLPRGIAGYPVEDILTVEVEEGECLDLPIPYLPESYSKFASNKRDGLPRRPIKSKTRSFTRWSSRR